MSHTPWTLTLDSLSTSVSRCANSFIIRANLSRKHNVFNIFLALSFTAQLAQLVSARDSRASWVCPTVRQAMPPGGLWGARCIRGTREAHGRPGTGTVRTDLWRLSARHGKPEDSLSTDSLHATNWQLRPASSWSPHIWEKTDDVDSCRLSSSLYVCSRNKYVKTHIFKTKHLSMLYFTSKSTSPDVNVTCSLTSWRRPRIS